jgi:hypothetical protein
MSPEREALAGQPRPTKDECHAALGLWLGVRR